VALVKNKPQIQEALTRVSQDAQTAIQDTFRAVVDTAKAAKAPDGRIGEVIKSTAKTIRDSEGKDIGAFKSKAIAATKNARVPMPENIRQIFGNIVNNLDVNPQLLGKLSAEDITERMGKYGITDPGQMRSFTNSLNALYKQSENGVGKRFALCVDL